MADNREIRRTLQNLLPGSRYATRVRAVSELGQYSEWSEALEFVAEASGSAAYDLEAPPAPTVQPQINAITVIMNYTAENDGITSYILEHSTNGTTFSEIARTQIPLYVHQVPPGQTHYYRFKVIDVYGSTSDPSPYNSGQALSSISHKPYATVVVAAYDSVAEGKENADFICDGVDDHVTINAAITKAQSGAASKVLLLEGTYHCSGSLDYVESIEGMGTWATIIYVTANIDQTFISTGTASKFSIAGNNFMVDGTVLDGWFTDQVEIFDFSPTTHLLHSGFSISSSYLTGGTIGTTAYHVANCDVSNSDVGIEINGTDQTVIGNKVDSYGVGIALNASGCSVVGNTVSIRTSGAIGIQEQAGQCSISGNVIKNATGGTNTIGIDSKGTSIISGNMFQDCGVDNYGTASVTGNYFYLFNAANRCYRGRSGSTVRFKSNLIWAINSSGIPPIRIDNDVENALVTLNSIDLHVSNTPFSDAGIDTSYGAGNYINGEWVTGLVLSLDELTDVDLTGASSGDVLSFDGANWVAGSAASSDANYIHDQAVGDTVWTIDHNLGKRCSVTTIDSSSREIFGVVEYISDDQVTVTFNVATSGKAYCN